MEEDSVLMSQYSGTAIQINDNQANYARKISARMSLPLTRKKGLIDILGIVCAVEYFKNQGFKVNTKRSLHAIPEVFEEFKISDIYINNYRIDVISQFRDDTVKIPSLHKEYGCMPDFYVVVKLGDRLKDARVTGYFKGSDAAFLGAGGEYITVDDIYLKSLSTLLAELKKPACPKPIPGKHLDCVALFLRFIDKELASSNKKLLIQHLVCCPACSRKLFDVLEFNRTIKGIQNVGDIMRKYASSSLQAGDDTIVLSRPGRERFLPDKTNVSENIPDNTYLMPDEKYRNIIDGIFDKAAKIEPSRMGSIIGGRKKKIILTFFVIAAFLAVSTFIAYKNSNSDVSSISDVDSTYSQDSDVDMQIQADFASDHNLPQEVYGVASGSDYSIASQTTGEPLVATINKISWEVPENLANKANYTRFLQLVGKNVKLNLQNDLLLSSDFAKNNVIKLSIRIASNGDVIGMKMLQSSGSEPIDNIIKKSVSETLLYMKPPSHGLISRPVDVTLVINL